MLGEIIRELTKAKGKNVTITSGNVLTWAKRVEAQRAQSVVISTRTEAKEFDKIKVAKYVHKDTYKRTTQTRTPMKQTYRYCSNTHSPRQCPVYGKMCLACNKIGHFQVVYRSKRTRAVNEVEQETFHDNAGEDIEVVSINSVWFNKNCSVLTANLKTYAGQNNIIVPYKIDTGSNGNIMPAHVFRRLFPNVTNEQLAKTKNKHVLLKTYNKTTITQLGIGMVVKQHKNNNKNVPFS